MPDKNIFDVSDEDLIWVEQQVEKHGKKKGELIQILRDVQEHF